MQIAPSRLVVALAWLAAGAGVLLYDSTTTGLVAWQQSVIVLGVLSLALGVVGFYKGGSQLSAMNVWCFGFALFVGFAGIYTVTTYQVGLEVPYLLPALAIAYFGQVVIFYGWWTERMVAHTARPVVAATAAVTRLGIIRGAVLFVVAFFLSLRYPGHNVLAQATFAGGVLLCTAMFLRPARAAGTVVRVAVALVVVGLSARFIFDGFGRLQLGALGLAVAFAASARFKGRSVKVGILIVSVPVMLYLAHQRVGFTASLNPAQASSVTGFESAVSPLSDFSTLLGLHVHGQLGWHYLSTFWATLVLWVPHSIWPGKPPGFGAVMGHLFVPQLDGTGYSKLVLFQGEWLYSFGLPGLAAMIPVAGLGVRWLQDRLAPLWSRDVATNRDLLRLTLATVFIAGLPDLVWGGTFTYASRALVRAAVLVVVVGTPAFKRLPVPAGLRTANA